MKKAILFLGLLSLLASCSGNYKYKLTGISNDTMTVVINDDNPKLNNDGRLTSACGCSTYYENIKSIKLLGEVKPTKEEINNKHKKMKIFLLIIVFCILGILILWLFITTKQNQMTKILKYIVYGVGIILVFKIGLILIHYLPTIIENQLK